MSNSAKNPIIIKENLGEIYDTLDKSNSKKVNEFLNMKEEIDGNDLSSNNQYSYLYPSLDDPDFNIKIAERKEFYDARMEIAEIKNIEDEADAMCKADFELSPHQLFVRNFLSFETPYNSLLLYHGLGTGKTCSAISVAEEMRDYMKQMGIVQRIIVVASPNVQENFKLQLFDPRKLKQVDGLWNLRACTGNKYLQEINPMSMKGLSKGKVIRQVERIINSSYLFLGYLEFANMIQRKSSMEDASPEKIKRALRSVFQNRLIIIDEVQNIRSTEENTTNKRVASELIKLVENVSNIRLLLLSATPMFNSYKEIVWLINLMNKNDRRGTIGISEVFDKTGNFLVDDNGKEVGMDLLRRKINGYISFVKGENPLTFPFRIFPQEFSPENTFEVITPPRVQLNGKTIVQPLEHVNVFLTKIGTYQGTVYKRIIEELREKGETMPNFENMESFGYTMLQKPLMALNICYPGSDDVDVSSLIGSSGLENFMNYTNTSVPALKTNFSYKDESIGRIFSPELIGNYSAKIKNICTSIQKSKGIVLVYTNYIDGGAVPIALALEEMGLTRYGDYAKNLFKNAPTEAIDSQTFKIRAENTDETFRPAKYVIISGDKALSPNNKKDLIALTDEDNINGEKIKVVIITKAGSEGLDFKNIRQVHIMEPWYNMNLIEQVIGRAVRTCSHIKLPFIERNVQIFLYGTILDNEEEAADIYVYRLAELKAVQIGRVSRLMKESSIDCILNIQQNKYNAEVLQRKVPQQLSDGKTIDFSIGNKPFSASCDYLKTCNYTCRPYKDIKEDDVIMDTYSEKFIIMNSDKILQKIRDAFKEKYFYKKDDLIKYININRVYPIIQINAALEQLLGDRNEYLIDDYGRAGRLINIGEYYMFQPVELDDPNISVYDRMVPIPFKRETFNAQIKDRSLQDKVEMQDKVGVQDKVEMQDKVGVQDKVEMQDKVGVQTEVATVYPSSKGKKKLSLVDDMPSQNKGVLTDLSNKYDKVMELQDKVERGETDYYVFCSKIFAAFKRQGVNEDVLKKLLVEHLMQSLVYNEIMEVINYLYFNIGLTPFEIMCKSYFDQYILNAKGLTGLLLSKDNKRQLVIMKEQAWEEGEAEDYNDLLGEIEKQVLNKEAMNKYVGFFSEFKKEYMVFKVIDLEDPKGKGARCDQSGKNVAINLLNSIIGEENYTKDNTRGRNKMEFCIIQEFLLRLFNEQKKDDKIWFVTPIQAINTF
jgi:hypothetical protein